MAEVYKYPRLSADEMQAAMALLAQRHTWLFFGTVATDAHLICSTGLIPTEKKRSYRQSEAASQKHVHLGTTERDARIQASFRGLEAPSRNAWEIIGTVLLRIPARSVLAKSCGLDESLQHTRNLLEAHGAGDLNAEEFADFVDRTEAICCYETIEPDGMEYQWCSPNNEQFKPLAKIRGV